MSCLDGWRHFSETSLDSGLKNPALADTSLNPTSKCSCTLCTLRFLGQIRLVSPALGYLYDRF